MQFRNGRENRNHEGTETRRNERKALRTQFGFASRKAFFVAVCLRGEFALRCEALSLKLEKQADVAQLVEQSIRNRQVIGSSPIVGSILPGF